MRLTEKINTSYTYKNKNSVAADIFTKLGQLEDYEDKFEIDLRIIFKAIFEGMYIVDKDGKILHLIPFDAYPDFECNYIYSYMDQHEDFHYYFFKDYGKTWALTEQELENE